MNSCPVCFHKNADNATICEACGFDFTEFQVVLGDLSDDLPVKEAVGQENNEDTPADLELPPQDLFVTPTVSNKRKSVQPFVVGVFFLIIAVAAGFTWWISGSEKNSLLENSKENTYPTVEGVILSVTSEPIGATLYLDGKKVGETPFYDKKVETGPRTLRLVKKYYEPLEKAVDLQADKVARHHMVLENSFGELTILTQPSGASILIDSIKQDAITPITFQNVLAGKRTVLVQKDRYYDSEKVVEVLSDTTAKIDIILEGGNLEMFEGRWIEPSEALALRMKEQEVEKRAEELAAREQEKKRLTQLRESERLEKIREEKRKVEEARLVVLREARQQEEAKVRKLLLELEEGLQKGVSLEERGMLPEALKQFKNAMRNLKMTKFPTGILKDQRIDLQRRMKERAERVLAGEFIEVPGGCFQMGCNDWAGTCDSDEKPVHEVCVESFSIGKHEVTQSQWQLVMDYNPSKSQKGRSYPVNNVSWQEVQKFLQKLNLESSGFFRLPTEAEWEYACRSGGKDEKYCGGNSPDNLAWYESNSENGPHPVGALTPNGLGIYDMSGNVWEWCEDRYGEKYYGKSPKNNPTGPVVGPLRVIRGGSWGGSSRGVRSIYRSRNWPNYRGPYQGFRLVKPIEQ